MPVSTLNRGIANYISAVSAQVLHTGSGRIYKLVVSASAPSTLVLYNNTTNSGDKLLEMAVPAGIVELNWPDPYYLVFDVGLTVVTGADCAAHIVTAT